MEFDPAPFWASYGGGLLFSDQVQHHVAQISYLRGPFDTDTNPTRSTIFCLLGGCDRGPILSLGGTATPEHLVVCLFCLSQWTAGPFVQEPFGTLSNLQY